MSDPYLGEIRMVGFNFAPAGWAFCNGQLISISQNTALFALLGVQFGGNGTTTFALPNLQSRVAIHQGQGSGLSSYSMGQQSGVETVALSVSNLPAHAHTVAPLVSSANADQTSPVGAIPAVVNSGGRSPAVSEAYTATASNGAGAVATTSLVGGSVAHSNIQPYLCVNFIIALQGIFPSRS